MGLKELLERALLEGYAVSELDIKTMFICIGLTAAIALYIFLVYRMMNKNSFYSRSFGLSLVVLAVITSFYTVFREALWVAAAMRGVRAAVVPIILSALLGMLCGAFHYPPCFAVAILTFALYFFWNVSCVWLVVLGMVLGLLICEFYERKAQDVHAA